MSAGEGEDAELVFDTSSYINGQHDHLPIATFPSVWIAVGVAIDDGRIIVPREVYRELLEQDDDVAAWIREHEAAVVDPIEQVQVLAGEYFREFPDPGIRNAADPWVLAEAKHRRGIVVTYEGRRFSGVPTRRWHRSMPGLCQHFEIDCCTLPQALSRLGLTL